MRKLLFLACLSFALSSSIVGRSNALSCAPPSVFTLLNNSTDVVFVGELQSAPLSTDLSEGGQGVLYRYKVIEAIKGPAVGEVIELRYDMTWRTVMPVVHTEGTLVSASYDKETLVSVACRDWVPMNDATASQYGYRSVEFLKRDLLLYGETMKQSINTGIEAKSTDSASVVVPVAALVVSLATLLVVITVLLLKTKKLRRSQRRNAR